MNEVIELKVLENNRVWLKFKDGEENFWEKDLQIGCLNMTNSNKYL